ncbi:hypothetical protein MAPG_01961 [Magnaporthiopsis poae ATCC 64411]|uniref:Uncharacterized protein n=1 Tax=Magnaporthiopsis poae (strain ATCC 64411 / 73-15) TaxID=644358 RepID=A0A0C4DQ24_MAGP6|nr:hypothetical protein MAPG_01961 [Magnaporthiopsis poae ATCC 64411]
MMRGLSSHDGGAISGTAALIAAGGGAAADTTRTIASHDPPELAVRPSELSSGDSQHIEAITVPGLPNDLSLVKGRGAENL